MVPLHALLLLGFGTGMVLAATITPASLISYMGGTVTGQVSSAPSVRLRRPRSVPGNTADGAALDVKALLAAPFSFIMISNTTHILVSITASTVGMSKAGWFGFGECRREWTKRRVGWTADFRLV